jgi:MFS family permease
MKEAQLADPIALPRVGAQSRGSRRRSLASLAATSLVDRGEDQALSVLWPQMQLSLGASLGSLGLLLGLGRLVGTLTLPLWGYATDRWSRRMLLVCFAGFWGVWTLAVSLVETMGQLTALRLITALGPGVFGPALFSLLGDLCEDRRRGRAAGLILGAGTLGGLLAAALLPALASRGPEAWRLGFVVMGAASCATGLLLVVGLREPPRGGAEPELRGLAGSAAPRSTRISRADLQALSRIASWRLLLLAEALRAVGISLMLGWLFTWLTGIGLGSSMILIVVAFLLSIFVGQLSFGWLGDALAARFPRYGQLTLVLIGMLLVVPLSMLFVASDGQSFARLLSFALLSGFAGSAGVLIWPLGQAVVPPELRGSARAITEMLAGLASAAALVVSGRVADQLGVATALLLIAPLPVALSILAWLPLFFAFPRDRQALRLSLARRRDGLQEER